MITFIEQQIRFNMEELNVHYRNTRQSKRYVNGLRDCYELLLAVMRLRNNNPFKGKLLVPDKPDTKGLAFLIRRSDALINKYNKKIISRIQFEMKKPDSLYKMSDLAYAINTYLTGDEGYKTISISGIIDEEG